MEIMLDLETFGTKPGCALRSIGAVVFDFDGKLGAEFYANIDKQSCLDAGLFVDPQTEAWWAQQSKEAQDSLLVDPVPLKDAATRFNKWWLENRGLRVWSQGGNFDEPLWTAACAAVGVTVPWKFFNSRDTRTAYDLFALDTRTVSRAGTYHNALDDAKHQARCVALAVARGRVAKAEAA
jgi:hypothetical protein